MTCVNCTAFADQQGITEFDILECFIRFHQVTEYAFLN